MGELEIISDRVAMRSYSRRCKREGKRVALVPTMGYLHAGHLSLVKAARENADVVIVSIYVNPTQFRAGEDFDEYPRDVESDRDKLCAVGVDVSFEPESLYASDTEADGSSFVVGKTGHIPGSHETYVQVEQLQQGLCGVSRPHFFRGVATICTKLFNIVEPDVAVFGKKDYQQWRIICRLVRDLDFDIEIIGMPISREADGIAMSSRNVRLKPHERQNALCISRSLKWAQEAVASGVTEKPTIVHHISTMISNAGGQVDYVEVRHAENLSPVDEFLKQDTLIAIAAKFGSVRLLDNVVIEKDPTIAA